MMLNKLRHLDPPEVCAYGAIDTLPLYDTMLNKLDRHEF